ncbi:MAG TPA: YbaB/EbfC family nucleoid-associated protein [Clostridiales bacterium]|nr:YbaB/EbfC family nucleoid-associated protein [Clostridiales bacterium]
MAKGFNPMGGMNMNNIMKQAQKMQKQVQEVQEALGEKTLEVTSGGGAVRVVVSGAKEIKEINISKDVVDPDDVEMLEDMIVAAINEAFRKADEVTESEMRKVTGGVNIPGLL